jgi:hypothetical protein
LQPSGAAIRVPISILWLTSPVNPRKIFSACIGRIAVEVALFAILLATPVIDVPAVLGGARWLAAYSVVAAITICGHFDVANQFHPRDRWGTSPLSTSSLVRPRARGCEKRFAIRAFDVRADALRMRDARRQ